MYYIASIEGSSKRAVGYPYIISFNNKQDLQKISKMQGYKKINNRSIDCIEKNRCIEIAKKLIDNNVKNIDLGAFQINYSYHKMDIGKYFDLKQSYIKACDILNKLIKQYGYSWKTISKYHSFKIKHQVKYLTLLSKKIEKGQKQ